MANDNNIQPVADDSQIVLYQPDESISLQVKIAEDTVWLTQAHNSALWSPDCHLYIIKGKKVKG